mmetsp:Transcript_53805/g.123794  ORF Transcript_53805/g.123794 Transcript_53805/m.123794 type:complete len:205 (+) Transcript_53805:211-825(+)
MYSACNTVWRSLATATAHRICDLPPTVLSHRSDQTSTRRPLYASPTFKSTVVVCKRSPLGSAPLPCSCGRGESIRERQRRSTDYIVFTIGEPGGRSSLSLPDALPARAGSLRSDQSSDKVTARGEAAGDRGEAAGERGEAAGEPELDMLDTAVPGSSMSRCKVPMRPGLVSCWSASELRLGSSDRESACISCSPIKESSMRASR